MGNTEELGQLGKHKELTEEQRKNLSVFKVHKIKNPKEYGGFSRFVYLWVLIPIIGFIFGVIGILNKNELKKVQGKAMILASILGAIFYAHKAAISQGISLACSGKEETSLVTEIAKEQLDKYNKGLSDKFIFSVDAIRTISTNKQTGALECAANFEASANGKSTSTPITYTIEITDNKQEFYITVHGLD